MSTVFYSEEDALQRSLKYFNGDDLAASVFVSKYALRDNKNRIIEATPSDMHRRLAAEFARIEKNYPNPISEEEIFDYFEHYNWIIPQGSPMSAVGNPFQVQSCSNCFVIPSPEDSYGGIMKTDQEQAQIMKRRGGVGFDISHIRPRGLETKNAARTTDGIGVFMDRFSNTCREVAQNGRRGALMLTISCHHPEIRTFINIKKDRKRVTGANISIRLTDEFMKAVKNGTEVELRWPVSEENAKMRQMVDARELWKEIIEAAWQSAEPGLLFWDTAQKYTPSDIYKDFGYESIATNPCVTGDTWVMTDSGPKQVFDLVDNGSFRAAVAGSVYSSTDKGFWHTGKKQTIIIKTKEGFELECTPDHRILTAKFVNRQKITEWKAAKDIGVGDQINLEDHSANAAFGWHNGNTGQMYDEGYLLGSLVGDGCICGETAYLSWWGGTKEHMHKYVSEMTQRTIVCRSDLGSGSMSSSSATDYDRVGFNSKSLKELADRYGISVDKIIPAAVEKTSASFYKGFLSGWFDTDGTINCCKDKQRCDVRLCSSTLVNLKTAQRMLARLGIISKIYENRKEAGTRRLPDGNGGQKEYFCKASHELIITKDNIARFAERIGFVDPDKAQRLDSLIASYGSRGFYKEKFVAEVRVIEDGSIRDVYDCSVDTVNCFDANGVTVHNCGEIILSAYDSCRLLCVNLFSFVTDPFTSKARFDFEKMEKISGIAQRLMDDMIDIEIEQIDKILAKIDSDPESDDAKYAERKLWNNIKTACINGRRTGLGITALGDAIAALNVRYGSKESIVLTEQIYKALAIGSYRSSCVMAKERGAFPIWNANLEKNHPFLERIWNAAPDVYELYKKYGRRNIANTTTAPTGSVSTQTQTTSGVEPAFLIFYLRWKKINPNDHYTRVDRVDELGDKWQCYPVFHHHFKTWMEANGHKIDENAPPKSIDDLPFYKDSPYYKATSNDVDWVASVDIQAAAQKWIDHAISKTCNVPKDCPKEVIAEVYMRAWEQGCKGFTVYRDGCRDGVLVATDSEKKASLQKTTAPKRPKTLECDIHHTKSKGEDFFVIVGLLDGHPYEVFAGRNGCITHAKKGKISKHQRGHYVLDAEDGTTVKDICDLLTDEQAVITRMISLSLRHGSDITFVVDQLEKSPGDMTNFGKAMARVLKKYIKDGTKVTGYSCEACGSVNVIRQEGCATCKDCGSSKCS